MTLVSQELFSTERNITKTTLSEARPRQLLQQYYHKNHFRNKELLATTRKTTSTTIAIAIMMTMIMMMILMMMMMMMMMMMTTRRQWQDLFKIIKTRRNFAERMNVEILHYVFEA